MNDNLKIKIQSVDRMLEVRDYSGAVSVLQDLAHEFPSEGIIPYYLGRLCLVDKDELLSYKYFTTAVKLGYTDYDVYISLALIEKDMASVNKAEKSFLKALEVATTEELKWTCMSTLSVFYIENEMYLKAEKYVKKLIAEYPDSYQGYHLHIIIEALREHFDEVLAYMDRLPDMFKNHPQYLIDIIEIYKKSGKDNELSVLLKNDLRFTEIIPSVVLREEILSIPNDEHDDGKGQLIRRLAKEYHDKDAVMSVMILEFSRKNFEKSAKIANVILENEKGNQSLNHYLAMYFQIFSLYYMAEKKPSEKLRKWIEDAGNWCISYAESLGMPAVTETVSDSIQELFDEINKSDEGQE